MSISPGDIHLEGDAPFPQEPMAPIRIALCITDLDIGGAERCLTELAIRMDRRRFEPVVYALSPRPSRVDDSFLPMLSRAGVPVHFLGGRRILQFPVVVARLKKLLRQQSPQLLQTFLFHANVVGRVAARLAGVDPVVAGIRVAEQGSRWHLWLDRLTQGWVERYVCVSEAVARFSAEHGGLSPQKLVVIPNGIDLTSYPAQQPADGDWLGVPRGRRLVTFVGRLAPQKGLEWLMTSLPLWMDKASDCDLLLVGDGPLRGKIETMARASGMGNRVHLLGRRSDVSAILAASELLVLPSRWEGMPNVVLEAMATGKPVVASEVEGVCELLGSAAIKQTVPYGNTQALCQAILAFLDDPALAGDTGRENRRQAERKFDISLTVRAYEQLWESLVRT